MADEKRDIAEKNVPKKCNLVRIRGLYFPGVFAQLNDVEKVLDFKPQDTDVFVVTYPKCGTTWTQYIVWEILHKGIAPPSPNQMMFGHFPFLEFTGVDMLPDIPPPRTMKTHLPFNLQPYNPKAKYIYAVRSPWDCCVSYYYHLQFDSSNPEMTFDEYFELFIRGELPWGDYFDHVLSWYEHRNDPNVLFITYESMKKEKKKSLLSIAKFLGDRYFEELVNDEEVLENCLKYSDFKYMKELGVFFPKDSEALSSFSSIEEMQKKLGHVERSTAQQDGFAEINFFRKGEVGDWKNHFSSNQIKKFNDHMLQKVKNTEMENFWRPLENETAL